MTSFRAYIIYMTAPRQVRGKIHTKIFVFKCMVKRCPNNVIGINMRRFLSGEANMHRFLQVNLHSPSLTPIKKPVPTCWSAVQSSRLLIILYNTQSSANNCIVEEIPVQISFIKIRNNRWPKQKRNPAVLPNLHRHLPTADHLQHAVSGSSSTLVSNGRFQGLCYTTAIFLREVNEKQRRTLLQKKKKYTVHWKTLMQCSSKIVN